MDGKEKKWRLFSGWGGNRPAPLMKNWYKNKYINHQKLFSFKTSRGNYSQFLWHVRYVNNLEYLSVSEQLIKLQWAKYIVLAHFFGAQH